MKNIARDSSFLTHCNVVSTPSIKEGFTANPNIDAYSLLQSALQVFDEMSMKKMKTISLSQLATMTASVPVMVRQLKVLLSFDNLKCFDPGGMIPLLFLPTSSVFISFQFPSRMSLPIPPEPPDWVAVQESSLQFPLCVTTEDFLRSSWRLQCYLQDLAAISESNGSVDYFNGLIKILLQHSQELTHELQFVHTWSYLSDFFHDVCLYSLGNIHSYFNDCARGRILHFVFKAGGIKHIIGELLDKHLISQWYEAKEVRFCAPNFLLFLLAIFGSKIWIMNLVYEESQSLYLMALGSNIGTHTLVKIKDGKNMKMPNIYRQMDSYYGVLTTSFFRIAKLHVSHLDASLDKEKGDNRVYHGDNFFFVTSTNFCYFGKHMILESLKCRKETYKDLVAVMIPATQEWWRKYPSRKRNFRYCKYGLLCLHLGISNGVFNHLIGLCINMVAIQKKLNHKFKVQGLPSIVTSDFNKYFISTVWKEPFQIQGDSMINSIASSPNSNFLRLLQLLLLKLCQKSHFDVVNLAVKSTILHRKMIPRGQLLLSAVYVNRRSVIVTKILLKWRDLPLKHDTWKFAANVDLVVAILHRKMIERGSVHVPLVLLKWKTLPPKHGTCDFSSLRTRMFEGEGIVTGISIRILIILILVYFMSIYYFSPEGCI
ncbi:uncharacterized protein LOC123918996 [Trifolium pratense]|uniref:uncharacterized protein LOC123918996 n=1 Tax=Trifolium pratense TaxID=57577 RepID=UPI001E690845|nr:uncharacterized protein LOC123918996 [Trifolium pratense]